MSIKRENYKVNLDKLEKYFGWKGEKLAKEQFDLIGGKLYEDVRPKNGWSASTKKRMLYQLARQVLNKDIAHYAQRTGDCVAFSCKNAKQYRQCTDIILNGDNEVYKEIHPSFDYGISRVQIGGGRIWGAGSLVVWAKEGSLKYGSLFYDDPNVPDYSGRLSDTWGKGNGPPSNFLPVAKPRTIVEATRVRSWAEVVENVVLGRPVAVGSNWGFNMQAGRDGFHAPRGTWAHAMTIIGVDDSYSGGSYGIILNSWGDVHGRLKDFETGEDLPIGCLRVRAETIHRMVQDDAWAYGDFNGEPGEIERKIDKSLFYLI